MSRGMFGVASVGWAKNWSVTAIRLDMGRDDMPMIAVMNDENEAAGGDPAGERALRGIVDEHRGAVLAVLRRRYAGALGVDDIDDVVAVATHRMWKGRQRISELRSPRAWFLRVADNAARDVLRYGWQKARQLEVAADAAWLGSFPDAPKVLPAPEEGASGELVEALREIVAALPEAQRRIVWADALNPDGLVASELLAAELGIPAGTVRVYRKRGLDRIRQEVEKRDLNPNKR